MSDFTLIKWGATAALPESAELQPGGYYYLSVAGQQVIFLSLLRLDEDPDTVPTVLEEMEASYSSDALQRIGEQWSSIGFSVEITCKHKTDPYILDIYKLLALTLAEATDGYLIQLNEVFEPYQKVYTSAEFRGVKAKIAKLADTTGP
jgi:hypothetical protein